MTKKRNKSPWLHQLDHDRPVEKLSGDSETDVVVVGAGIAGVSTSYFTLTKTNKKVLLVERFRLAHGASGHNAGLVVADFERPLSDLEKEFGFERASEALKSVERGWTLLDQIYHDAGLDIPFSKFTEKTGLLDIDHIKLFIAEADFRRRCGLPFFPVKVAKDKISEESLRDVDQTLIVWVDQEELGLDLESIDDSYIGLAREFGGVLNSALFCQEIVRYLQKKYSDRFKLIEETKIEKIVLKENEKVILDAGTATITAKEVVLCTNGFEDFTIVGENGLCLDKEFHRNIRGIVGYMSGYLTPLDQSPAGLVYLNSEGFSEDEAYYYVTRRPYEYDRGAGIKHNLISVGGPQVLLEDHNSYNLDEEYPKERADEIQKFVDKTYKKSDLRESERVFEWHGLMGYTRGMIRMVGPHPAVSKLFYNLGCNGIGILPSIWGGETVARYLAGEDVAKTIFTPDGGVC